MPEHKFNENIEEIIAKIVVDDEFSTAKRVSGSADSEMESIIEMLECKRGEKDYDWMSDVFIPELPSIILTDASGWASQYFQSRDFVEVKLEGDKPNDEKKCRAAKKCINKTLNRRDLYHYSKYMRARTINSIRGNVFSLCWWNQDLKPVFKGFKKWEEKLSVDIQGNEIIDPENQVPATKTMQEPVIEEEPETDQFEYEIIDPRNIFTDSKYCYSIQQKDWVIIRDEVKYEDLKNQEKKKGYFNLDLVKELKKSQTKTDTSQETYAKEDDKNVEKPQMPDFDRLLRFGKMYCVVDKEKGTIEPGYNKDGDVLEKAEVVQTILEYIVTGNQRILIRFQRNPYEDSFGRNFYPIIRGWAYIHPTKDEGLSDGKYLREIQKAINDNFNMGADRVKLATIPTLQANKYMVGEDNPTIYFEPGHLMETEGDDVIREFKIDDNIQGTLQIHSMLESKGQQVSAVFPTTMGGLPEQASTTATAIAGAETRSNVRGNYKSLTFEYTFLCEFYWMLLQMFAQFSHENTAKKILGDDMEFFDPDADYTYTPVSSNIEMEYNKSKKVALIEQLIGRLVAFPNPKTTTVINKLLSKVFEYLGDEFPQYGKYLLDENVSPTEGATPAGDAAGGVGQNVNISNPMPATNQTGNIQTPQEMGARGNMGGMQ